MSKLFTANSVYIFLFCIVTYFSSCTNAQSAHNDERTVTAVTLKNNKQITIDVSSPIKLSESTLNGTLISAYSKDKRLLFSAGFPLTWNTISANALGEMHLFVRTSKMDASFIALPRKVAGLHSAYIVKNNRQLYLLDEVNNRYFQVKKSKDEYVIDREPVHASEEPFKNLGFKYSKEDIDSINTIVKACKITNPNECDKILISPKSVVFAYGGNESNTVAVTNKSDVLFHDKNGWCRGEKYGDGYKCNVNATKFSDNSDWQIFPYRGWQIYSSIRTHEGTLLGEYPTGRFWKLGHGTLEPTALSPFKINKHKNLELQSVSLFCGDLYAGFWPRGEVWKKPLESYAWEKVQKLFSHPSFLLDGYIPYRFTMLMTMGRNLSAFFGQRVTSMVNHQNSLFVVSGNYGRWDKNVSDPWFLTNKQIDEYGLVHYKEDSNCLTAYADDRLKLKIILTSNRISVFDNGKLIAETKLHDFNVDEVDSFDIGEGVFGSLSDKNVNIKVK